jgi:hypothetical protein
MRVNDGCQQLHEVLSPEYLEGLIVRGTAEKARLTEALKVLHPDDMAHESLTFLQGHLEDNLDGWRAELSRAKERVASEDGDI